MNQPVKVEEGKTFGCDDCFFYRGYRCRLWEVKVEDPHNSHCVSHLTEEEALARGFRKR
jgi:hypothetical protein